MSGQSNIEWTDATWNPIVGCSIKSPGCINCYAQKMAHRLSHNPATPHYRGTTKMTKTGPVFSGLILEASEKTLLAPLRWKKPRRIFVNSMGDLFHESIPDEWIDKVFAVMALCPQHQFQVLTKRAERMRDYFARHDTQGRVLHSACFDHKKDEALIAFAKWNIRGYLDIPWPLPNVWLGISAERQQEADERIPHLLQTPAAIRFVSCEPLLGPINLKRISVAGHGWQDVLEGWRDCTDYPGRENVLDWVIAGGESGPGARPMHPDWACSLQRQCAHADVPFFFKQWGAWAAIEVDASDPHGTYETRLVDPDGRHIASADVASCDFSSRSRYVYRLGKKRAGRLLDGIEHNGFPGC
jgi:protein gp37